MKRSILELLIGSKILLPVKQFRKKIIKKRFCRNLKRKIVEIRKSYHRIVFIVATPCHGNLGDHAIVYAEHRILKKSGFSDNVIEISNLEYERYHDVIRSFICPKDIIVIDGGGNLGTLWPQEDDKIAEIIQTYPENKIVIFPQTCYYDDSSEATQRLHKNRSVYANAKDLTIMLRDRQSYNFCEKNFQGVKLLHVPDIVTSVNYQVKQEREPVCMICFRKDLEKNLSLEQQESIFAELKNHQIAAKEFSTIYPGSVNANQREQLLTELWSEIGSAKLVITDRLHAMIFAVITGTPCMALDNKSKKVSGVYEWISQLPYVKVFESAEEMKNEILVFYQKQAEMYPLDLLKTEFEKVTDIFKEEI